MNQLEIDALRYWSACQCLRQWNDTATIVLCHLVETVTHPRLRLMVAGLAARCDEFHFMDEPADPEDVA